MGGAWAMGGRSSELTPGVGGVAAECEAERHVCTHGGQGWLSARLLEI